MIKLTRLVQSPALLSMIVIPVLIGFAPRAGLWLQARLALRNAADGTDKVMATGDYGDIIYDSKDE